MNELGWVVVLDGEEDLNTALDSATRCRSLTAAENEAHDLQKHGHASKVYKIIEVANYTVGGKQ